MSASLSRDASRFLIALGSALESGVAHTDSQAVDLASQRLWMIAPLSSRRRGSPAPGRNFDANVASGMSLLVAGIAALSDCVYDHAAVAALIARDPSYAQRSRSNLAAIVHPQNPLRPFDALHTIGRSLLPLPLLNMFLERDAARQVLATGFQIDWLGQEEPKGAWAKAWFVGLLMSLYLCWKWHGLIPVSVLHPGWFGTQPLARFKPSCAQIDPDIRLPGMASDLVTANQNELTLSQLTQDWTDWKPREKIGVPGTAVRVRSLDWQRGAPAPAPLATLSFEMYAFWLLACLGLYRGASDARLHGDGLLDALLDLTGMQPLSRLQGVVAQHLLCLPPLEHLPLAPVNGELAPAWGEMMRDLLRMHRRAVDEDGTEQEGLALACYPIESWIRSGEEPSPGTLGNRLGQAMPRFREVTSLLWMFFTEDPLRLRHPADAAD